MSGDTYTTHPDAATLNAYHDGELRGFARAEVEAHLAICPRCRREVSDLDALTTALRSLPGVEPPPRVHDAVQARIAGLRPRRRWLARPSRRIVAVILVVIAALAGYDVLMLPGNGIVPAFNTALPPAPTSHANARATMSAAVGATRFSAQAPAAPAPSRSLHAPASVSGADTQDTLRAPIGAVSQPGVQRPGVTPPNATSLSLPTLDARLIARTGDVELHVPDVQKAYTAVSRIATREGGYVSDSNNAASSGASGASATLTLRVPAANFQAAMSAIAALPHSSLRERSSSQDVTDSYHNLQARLQALQATRTQLMTLMRQAHSIRDAMTVLDRLTAINTNIDGVQGQIMSSANSVMLSTISVTLTPEPRAGAVVAPRRPHHQSASWQPGRDLANAVANLSHALQAIASIAIYAAVYLLLPALLAALTLVTRRLWRPAGSR